MLAVLALVVQPLVLVLVMHQQQMEELLLEQESVMLNLKVELPLALE